MRLIPLLTLALLACRGEGSTDADGDGVTADLDCNDGDATVHPDADETCNGIDDDCSGAVDDAPVDAGTFYADDDDDGYGDPSAPTTACDAPEGTVTDATDCDDADPTWHPGAAEEDCADPNDYNCDGQVGYADADGDGFAACEDCDDASADAHPGAEERCNGVDDDCDGAVDAGATDASAWYADTDGDGFGAGDPTAACAAPEGAVADATDCDDADAATHPGATETCDAADDDCDGETDEDASDALTFYVDGDGDGFGTDPVQACALPGGAAESAGDCDDAASTVFPGADEVCDDVDQDCDGTADDDATDAPTWYADTDGDGHGDPSKPSAACEAPTGHVAADDDCDDAAAAVRPGATETCNDRDDDCDGEVDVAASDAGSWYLDEDGDGFGTGGATVACEAPSPKHASEGGDCDDADDAYHPEATPGCDGEDYDCDGAMDHDADEDGYPDAACGGDDCDDADADKRPEPGRGCALGAGCADVAAGDYGDDGAYLVDPDGFGTGAAPRVVWCDVDDGGWTLVAAVANRWAKSPAPGPFFTQDVVQEAGGWKLASPSDVISPTSRGVLKVDAWPAPSAILYQNVEVATGVVKNEVLFDDPSSIDHLQTYATERDKRPGKAIGSSTPFAKDLTFYLADDHRYPWWYWGGIMGRYPQSEVQGWQFGLSVNYPDKVPAYDGVHDDSGRAEYNLGVGAKSNENLDITGYWAGQCTTNCNETWAANLPANGAVTYVWFQ